MENKRKSLKRKNNNRNEKNQKENNERKNKEKSYFKPGNRLTDDQKKYCRCVYHVAAQQTPECLRRRNWKNQENSKAKNRCYNPYAICSKSVKRKGRIECFKNTNLGHLPSNEQKALADLKQMTFEKLLEKVQMKNN